MSTTPTRAFTTPSTYTVSVNGGMNATVKAVAGGGRATTTETNIVLLAGKTYTLTVGAGAARLAAGGDTCLLNTTDSVTLVSLSGGATGSTTPGVQGGACVSGNGSGTVSYATSAHGTGTAPTGRLTVVGITASIAQAADVAVNTDRAPPIARCARRI